MPMADIQEKGIRNQIWIIETKEQVNGLQMTFLEEPRLHHLNRWLLFEAESELKNAEAMSYIGYLKFNKFGKGERMGWQLQQDNREMEIE